VSDDHSSLDELADLDEGLLQPSRADEVRAHLAGCAACRDRHQALRDVHDELAVLPPETMPPGVVEKLDRALAAAATPRSATIVPFAPVAQRRRGQHRPAIAGVAAAIVVIGFFAAFVVGALGHGGTSDGGSASAGSGSAVQRGLSPLSTSHFTKSVSSKTFTHTTVDAEVRRLVSGQAGAAGSLGPSTTSDNQSLAGLAKRVPLTLRPLYNSPSSLLHCAAILTGQKNAVPLAVEFTRYTTASVRHAPSVLFVFPIDPTHVRAFVTTSDCASQLPIRDVVNVPIG
jgi:hypothetical protein